MDDNVKQIKNLLEQGYKITQHNISMRKENNIDIMTDTILLEKGKDKQTITSTNSAEFFDYIHHFKKIKDNYGNVEFTYVEDIGRYNQMFKGSPGDVFLKDHHLLRISGREFNTGIITMHFNPSGPHNSKGIAMFRINLEQNPDFKKIDLKDELLVYEKNPESLKFRGLVKEFFIHDNEAHIITQDVTLRMEHQRVSAEFNKMNPADCMNLMVTTAGLTFCPDPKIKYNTSEREFIVIMPINNLIINESFNIGTVEFYQMNNTLDESLIRKSNTGRKETCWNGNFPRAKVKVKANTFYDAIIKGHLSISNAINIIAMRTDLSLPQMDVNGISNDIAFDYFKYYTRVKIPTWIYCREFESEAHLFFNMEWLTENTLSLELHPENYFRSINQLFDTILTKETRTQEESNLLLVINWLRRAIQIGDNKDKLLDLWTAIEFLISGTATKQLFSNVEIKQLKEHFAQITTLSEDQNNAVHGKIDMLNDSPLLEKFSTLITQLGIDFSEEELRIFRNSRTKRNDLIHGRKDIDVKDEELNKMRTIIERIIITKIQRIKAV